MEGHILYDILSRVRENETVSADDKMKENAEEKM